MVNRFIFKEDYPGHRSWSLLDWCVQRGADEFSLQMLWLEGSDAPLVEAAEKELARFALAPAPREFVIGTPSVREAPLWSLTSESIAVLKRLFVDGLFMNPTSAWEEGCFEDPTFYRRGALLLGIVTHEFEGLLSVTEAELAELEQAGYTSFERSKWL